MHVAPCWAVACEAEGCGWPCHATLGDRERETCVALIPKMSTVANTSYSNRVSPRRRDSQFGRWKEWRGQRVKMGSLSG